MNKAALEAALLADPFDLSLREQYAALLLSEGDPDNAITQYQLLIRQQPDSANYHIALAKCFHAKGDTTTARQHYEGARSRSGFRPDPDLEPPQPILTTRAGPLLAVVDGGRQDNVVAFASRGRERIRFADIAGLEDLKKTIRLQIIEPFLKPGLFERFRKRSGGGVLLYGPPGCGKTMMARALATECDAEFIPVGIADILDKFIGESERNLAAMFDRARQNRPAVLFFDELDALAYARSKAHSEWTRQVVNEFLAQLDGFSSDNQGVLILAATNMPWDVDSAMKRPGRFSRQVFVPPPDEAAREHLVQLKLDGVPSEGIDAAMIARITPHFSGADIEGLVELAKDLVLEDHLVNHVERNLRQNDLLKAVESARASTLDWLRTARNLVKYAGGDDSYREVETYLKKHRIS